MNPSLSRSYHSPLVMAVAALGVVVFALAQSTEPAAPLPSAASVTVFSNVRIFDGKSDTLSPPSHVLVRGNLIEKISVDPIPADRRADTVLMTGAAAP